MSPCATCRYKVSFQDFYLPLPHLRCARVHTCNVPIQSRYKQTIFQSAVFLSDKCSSQFSYAYVCEITMTCRVVRLLGPCFKTGQLRMFHCAFVLPGQVSMSCIISGLFFLTPDISVCTCPHLQRTTIARADTKYRFRTFIYRSRIYGAHVSTFATHYHCTCRYKLILCYGSVAALFVSATVRKESCRSTIKK